MKGNKIFINLTHDITLQVVKDVLPKFDVTNRPIHCHVDELYKVGLKHYHVLGLFTQFSNGVHLRYFKEGRLHNALCLEHDWIKVDPCRIVRIMILNDCNPNITMPSNRDKHLLSSEITLDFQGVKVQCIKFDLEHHFFIHIPSGTNDDKVVMKTLIHIISEISLCFKKNNHPYIFLEAMKKPDIELKPILDAFMKINIPCSNLKTQIYYENTHTEFNKILSLNKCLCIHCHAILNQTYVQNLPTKVSVGKMILQTKKQMTYGHNKFRVSNIGFYKIPEADATSSAYHLEEECEPKPLATNEYEDDPRLEGYKMVDTENVPPEEKEFYKKLIKAFKHVFFAKSQFWMIRDRRVRLHL